MVKFFLAIISLFWAPAVLAHVGEEVEEHAGDAVQSGPAIGSWVLVGILAAAIIGFLVWVVIKK